VLTFLQDKPKETVKEMEQFLASLAWWKMQPQEWQSKQCREGKESVNSTRRQEKSLHPLPSLL
jgi:hypothetical protein